MIDNRQCAPVSKANAKPRFLSVIGPTASGKSSLALNLAKALDAELVNCDSVQVYRGFDIGSAKSNLTEQESVPHHLLDCAAWNEDFDASRFAAMARSRIWEINQRQKLAIVVGGSGLYLRFLWGESFHELPSDTKLRKDLNLQDVRELYEQLTSLDPERAQQLHPKDKFRVTRALEINILSGKTVGELTGKSVEASFLPTGVIFLNRPRPELHRRIAKRAAEMLELGLIEEVRTLLARGCPVNAKPMLSIGYKQVVEHLHYKTLARSELLEKIIVATRQYAKRQLTWYQKVHHDIAIDNSELSRDLMGKIENLLSLN
ncbi:MAG: tRNA (adenosine(37)-N6)-dimethylallyltransferase MiaA [Oligoflexales bacterium]